MCQSACIRSLLIFAAVVVSPSGTLAQNPPSLLPPGQETYLALADELETVLREAILEPYFPRAVDHEHGGFHAPFDADWTRLPSTGKATIYQARSTWTAAQVAVRRPDLREDHLEWTRHGLAMLEKLHDQKYGAFFSGLNDAGEITEEFSDRKNLYAISFGIYASAAAYEATGDSRALDLARSAWRFLETHAADRENGGYFEVYSRDGTPLHPQPPYPVSPEFVGASLVGYKSMNSHIHLLEAYTELYRVWPDPDLRTNLHDLLIIVRDRIAVEPGALNLYFTYDWRPLPDHNSYGHDVETAFLLYEAAEVLGVHDDPRTLRMIRLLVDHALEHGWDDTYGGFYYEGSVFGTIYRPWKEWWVQAEGVNALLLMHELFGDETAVYFDRFQEQWRFFRDHQVDRRQGGVHARLSPDGREVLSGAKIHNWKSVYHDGRALLFTADRLRRIADDDE